MNKKVDFYGINGGISSGHVIPLLHQVWQMHAKQSLKQVLDISVKRAPGESIVMTMSQIGTIFQNRYPNAALHSVELNSNDLNYGYKVVGYSKYLINYKMKIDVITGNASDMDEGANLRKLLVRFFNKDKVIESTQAERVAKQQLGNDAVMKGWKIEAHNGKVFILCDYASRW